MGSQHLVLTSHGFAQHFLLDVNGRMRELRLAWHGVLQRIERMQQPDRERGTGPQARTRRQITVMMDLKPGRDVHVLEDTANGRMFDLTKKNLRSMR